MNRTAVIYALASAVLFGISTPAAKALMGSVHLVTYLDFRSVNRSDPKLLGRPLWVKVRNARKDSDPASECALRNLQTISALLLLGGVNYVHRCPV